MQYDFSFRLTVLPSSPRTGRTSSSRLPTESKRAVLLLASFTGTSSYSYSSSSSSAALKGRGERCSLDCWPKHRFNLVRSRFRLQSCPRCFHFLKRFSKNFSLSKLKRPVLLPLPYRYFWEVGVEMSRPPHPFFLVSSSMELFRVLSQFSKYLCVSSSQRSGHVSLPLGGHTDAV